MVSTTLEIEGMTCGHCVAAVRKALAAVEGATVETVAVGSATVSFDSAETSPDAIASAVGKAGYSVVGQSNNTGV